MFDIKRFLDEVKLFRARILLSEETIDRKKVRIILQNILIRAVGHEGEIDSMSFLEYQDYDDYITESHYAKLLRQYRDNAIGDYFNISSEEFLALPAEVVHIYLEVAGAEKKREYEIMEAAQNEINQEEKEPVPQREGVQAHPTQQMMYDAKKNKAQEPAPK